MTEFIPPGTHYFTLPSPFPMKRGGGLHSAVAIDLIAQGANVGSDPIQFTASKKRQARI